MNILILFFSLIFVIIGIILIVYSNKIIKEAKSIKITKQNLQKDINNKIIDAQEELNEINDDIIDKREELRQAIDNFKNMTTTMQEQVDENVKLYEENQLSIVNQRVEEEEALKQIKINEIDLTIQERLKEKNNILSNLNEVKSAWAAIQEAKLREIEIKEKADFYKIKLDKKYFYEISVIKSIEGSLSDPRPLRMLIWSTYYSKKANELCSRVIGTTKKTGIYKITDLKTEQVYIGQAKDIKERWREHMKHGLGIDMPAGNKLYIAMLRDGLENFTFEVLEECESSLLNEKEKFYIELYQSNHFGFNSTKGNK